MFICVTYEFLPLILILYWKHCINVIIAKYFFWNDWRQKYTQKRTKIQSKKDVSLMLSIVCWCHVCIKMSHEPFKFVLKKSKDLYFFQCINSQRVIPPKTSVCIFFYAIRWSRKVMIKSTYCTYNSLIDQQTTYL